MATSSGGHHGDSRRARGKVPEPSEQARLGFKKFLEVWRLFPVKSQTEIDQVVAFLRSFVDDPQDPWVHALYWRAQAWLSYACMTAWADKWNHKSKDQNGVPIWGPEIAALQPGRLKDYALDLAIRAYNNEHGLYEYDTLWARAFARLYNNGPGDAEKDYQAAIGLSDPTSPDCDFGLYAEAADGFVYLGLLSEARDWIGIALASNNPPAWYRWVDGWVHLAEGILKSDPVPRLLEFDQASAAIEGLPKRTGATIPQDYDASIVWMSALALSAQALTALGRAQEATQKLATARVVRDEFNAAVRAEKGHGVQWSAAQEIRRSPFAKNTVSDKIAGEFEDSLDTVYALP